MRPNAEEVLRGAQRALSTHVLPELQTRHAQSQLMFVATLLGIAANDWDGATQRLVDDNASWRALAARAAAALATGDDALALELRALAHETDASLRLSDLSSTNARLRDALARAAVVADAQLRSEIIDALRVYTDAHALSLLGPRSDG